MPGASVPKRGRRGLSARVPPPRCLASSLLGPSAPFRTALWWGQLPRDGGSARRHPLSLADPRLVAGDALRRAQGSFRPRGPAPSGIRAPRSGSGADPGGKHRRADAMGCTGRGSLAPRAPPRPWLGRAVRRRHRCPWNTGIDRTRVTAVAFRLGRPRGPLRGGDDSLRALHRTARLSRPHGARGIGPATGGTGAGPRGRRGASSAGARPLARAVGGRSRRATPFGARYLAAAPRTGAASRRGCASAVPHGRRGIRVHRQRCGDRRLRCLAIHAGSRDRRRTIRPFRRRGHRLPAPGRAARRSSGEPRVGA